MLILIPGRLIRDHIQANTDDGKSYIDDEDTKEVFVYTFIFYAAALLTSTYIVAIWKWFSIEHQVFWTGFKELLWALCPVANIFYAYDIWFSLYILVKGYIFS